MSTHRPPSRSCSSPERRPPWRAPAARWLCAAIVATLSFRVFAEYGVLPSTATFVDMFLAWGLGRSPRPASPACRANARVAVSIPRRPDAVCTRLGCDEQDRVASSLRLCTASGHTLRSRARSHHRSADPTRPAPARSSAVGGCSSFRSPLRSPRARRSWNPDDVQGTLLGAGAGAHVISGHNDDRRDLGIRHVASNPRSAPGDCRAAGPHYLPRRRKAGCARPAGDGDRGQLARQMGRCDPHFGGRRRGRRASHRGPGRRHGAELHRQISQWPRRQGSRSRNGVRNGQDKPADTRAGPRPGRKRQSGGVHDDAAPAPGGARRCTSSD